MHVHGGPGGGGFGAFIRFDENQPRPAVTRKLLRRVAGYARPYVGRIGLMMVAMVATTGLGVIPPLLYRDLIDQALPNRDFQRLNLLALGMIAIPLANGLIGVGQRYLSARVGEGVTYDLRRALFDHMQAMSLRFFTRTRTGELMSRLNNDVVGAQQAVTSTLINIFSNVITLATTLAIMLSLEWRLTVASVLILPLFLLPTRRVGTILRQLVRESLNNNAQMNALMNETLNVSGALLVKLFGRGRDEERRFAERAARVRDVGVRQAVVSRWFFLGLGLVSAVGTALVFWLGAQLVLQQAFTIGTIVAFGAYLGQLYGPLSALTNARVEFATSMVSFERVFEVLDLPVEIQDRPGAVDLTNARGEVRFEDVSFSYREGEDVPGLPAPVLSEVQRWDWRNVTVGEGVGGRVPGVGGRVPGPGAETRGHGPGASDDRTETTGRRWGESSQPQDAGTQRPTPDTPPRWALRNVSFAIQPGQLAALVGPSGAGKTTITYLLPRLYDPTAGRILVDGVDLRDLMLQSLSAQIGMVTQETYLLHDTVRANLLYARSDASQSQLEEACRLANIHDLLVGLPDGYETVVGERGYRLSGGERQRLAIARVILKDPRILVLDEATSNLDSQSEALIQAALERVMRGRTSLVIAHRLSTVLAADVILVLDQGRLVETGTHEELVGRGGLYASLYETQFRRRPRPFPEMVDRGAIGDGSRG